MKFEMTIGAESPLDTPETKKSFWKKVASLLLYLAFAVMLVANLISYQANNSLIEQKGLLIMQNSELQIQNQRLKDQVELLKDILIETSRTGHDQAPVADQENDGAGENTDDSGDVREDGDTVTNG